MKQLIEQYVELANQIVEYGKAKGILNDYNWKPIAGVFMADDGISAYRGENDKTYAVNIGLVHVALYSKKIEFPYYRTDELQSNYDTMRSKFYSLFEHNKKTTEKSCEH